MASPNGSASRGWRARSTTVSRKHVVYDVALPPDAAYDVLRRLPDGAAVLIQKPLGRDFEDARRIRDLCAAKEMTAAVNLQLRFSPMMLAVAYAVERGLLGEIVDLEVRLACATPWQLWPFMGVARRGRGADALDPLHRLDPVAARDAARGAVAVPTAPAAPGPRRRPDHDDPRFRPAASLCADASITPTASVRSTKTRRS